MWEIFSEFALLRSLGGFYFGLSSMIFLLSIIRFSQYQEKPPETEDAPYPTVSLLIPARNEEHALEEFLENVLVCEYPKLEIIVVDDESNDNTTKIIRSFAHRGVRFLAGKPKPPDWVGKNFALQQLTQAASGDYLIYCDVDVRLQVTTIQEIIDYLVHYRVDFASFIPETKTKPLSSWLRYPLTSFWLHVLPWPLVGKTPALGNIMAIKKTTLEAQGGWQQYSTQLLPETNLANAIRRQEHYQLISGRDYGISLLKKSSSFDDTRQRYFYPILGASGWGVLAASLGAFLLLLGPFLLSVNLFLAQWWSALKLSLLAGLLLVSAFYVANSSNSRRPWLATLLFPVSLLWEIALMIDSYFRYQRGDIQWKERPVSQPKTG